MDKQGLIQQRLNLIEENIVYKYKSLKKTPFYWYILSFFYFSLLCLVLLLAIGSYVDKTGYFGQRWVKSGLLIGIIVSLFTHFFGLTLDIVLGFHRSKLIELIDVSKFENAYILNQQLRKFLLTRKISAFFISFSLMLIAFYAYFTENTTFWMNFKVLVPFWLILLIGVHFFFIQKIRNNIGKFEQMFYFNFN